MQITALSNIRSSFQIELKLEEKRKHLAYNSLLSIHVISHIHYIRALIQVSLEARIEAC